MKDYGSFSRHMWALPFEFLMAIGAGVTFARGDWLHVATSLFTLAISFAPLWFERLVRVRLPSIVQVMFVAFVFLSMFSGEVLGMYGRWWEWDDVMHFASGILIGTGGVVALAELVRERIRMPNWMQLALIFCFACTVAVLWEVVEFTSDQLFGTFSQGGDLTDTMMDLIDGAAGGLIVTGAMWLHLKGHVVWPLRALLRSYAKLNR